MLTLESDEFGYFWYHSPTSTYSRHYATAAAAIAARDDGTIDWRAASSTYWHSVEARQVRSDCQHERE